MSDSIIRDLTGYPTSRDYRKLWELAQRQSVVCVVDYDGGAQRDLERDRDPDPPCRDVAHTITTEDERGGMSVSARGISYIYLLPEKTVDDFERQCEAVNLEWIVPTNRNLRRELADLMSELSETHWCAGWLDTTEYDLWWITTGDWRQVAPKASPRGWGMGVVDADDVERLRNLSSQIGAWYDGDKFIPLGEWKALAADKLKRLMASRVKAATETK